MIILIVTEHLFCRTQTIYYVSMIYCFQLYHMTFWQRVMTIKIFPLQMFFMVIFMTMMVMMIIFPPGPWRIDDYLTPVYSGCCWHTSGWAMRKLEEERDPPAYHHIIIMLSSCPTCTSSYYQHGPPAYQQPFIAHLHIMISWPIQSGYHHSVFNMISWPT